MAENADSQGEVNTQTLTPEFECLANISQDNCILWGILMWNRNPDFEPLRLLKDKNTYSIGRHSTCDIILTPKHCDSSFITNVSREHCVLERVVDSTGTHFFLRDKSSNGTFINGRKIGKGNVRVLSHGDEIGLTTSQGKVFTFLNANYKNLDFPSVITKKYFIIKLLGKGAFGEVQLAFLKNSCKKYAIKSVLRNKGPHETPGNIDPLQQLKNEAALLCSLQHPCVVKVEDIVCTAESVHLILEFVEGGELFTRIKTQKQLSESTAKFYFMQLALAVQYFHQQGIVHRDLKPENILLSSKDEEAIIKVTDFGLSKLVEENTLLKTFCGTPHYVAPEVIHAKMNGSYTNKCDIWSMGVILFVCLSGYHPFMNPNCRHSLEEQILKGKVHFRADRWSGISEEGRNLVEKMLQIDPLKRLSMTEVLNHPWLNDPVVLERVRNIVFTNDNNNSLFIEEDIGTSQSLAKRIRLQV